MAGDYHGSLPILTAADGDVAAKICDGNTPAQQLAVDANGKIGVNALPADIDIRALTNEDVVTVEQPDATKLLASVEQSDESKLLATAKQAAGDIYEVHVNESGAGDQKHVYDDAVAGAPNTPVTVLDYTVTTGKTFLLKKVQGSAAGRCKIELKTGASGSEVLQTVMFTSTANPNGESEFPNAIEVAAGHKILVIVTNKDATATDLYAYINGVEVAA